jgi:hypothetical protein
MSTHRERATSQTRLMMAARTGRVPRTKQTSVGLPRGAVSITCETTEGRWHEASRPWITLC